MTHMTDRNRSQEKMAVAKIRFLVCGFLAIFISSGLCENTLFVLNAPKSVQFDSNAGPINVDEIQDVLTLSLGLSPSKDVKWSGLLAGNLFKRPKSSVLINIESNEGSALNPKHLASFPIAKEAIGFVETNYLMSSISTSFPTQEPILIDAAIDGQLFSLGSQYPNVFGNTPDSLDALLHSLVHGENSIIHNYEALSLNISKSSHLQFFSELQMLQNALEALTKNKAVVDDNVPDSMSFTLYGLRAIQLQHGPKSTEAKEASAVLESFLSQLSSGFMKLYDNNAVVMAVTTQRLPHFEHRMGRSILATDENPTKDSLNVFQRSEEFSAIFNIILWLSVILVLVVYATAYGMWYMDPGDTIIYRMTSQRIKMD
ncbi:renin receptor-like [Antedon mediterranea]|uniref:renin receptor-like n=1 Tax=Antedon mediterranea TaxID=105859 RepID=UPI003AF520FA